VAGEGNGALTAELPQSELAAYKIYLFLDGFRNELCSGREKFPHLLSLLQSRPFPAAAAFSIIALLSSFSPTHTPSSLGFNGTWV
jgi:hypothetical protein